MKLYPYQEEVLKCVKSNSSRSQLISMPTGTGKTITFLSLAKEFNKRTLILVHREELMNQTLNKAKLCGFSEEEISVINADKKEKMNKLNIAMVQSLGRNLEKYSPDEIELIIVDEAHHATANTYRKIFEHFNIFDKLLFGFTATPMRGDKDRLSDIFFEHSFKMTLSEATMMGYIVPVHGIRIEMKKSLSEIEMKQGDYDIQQLEKVMNCDSVNDLVVEKCENLTKTPSLIFCTSVDHAEKIAEKLRKKNKKAISVSYKTSKKTLSIIFKMLERGSIDYITNAVKLSEGFDHPAIKGVILARPTRSPVLYKQMIGRGLRNYPGKKDCYVLEFTSNDTKMMKWEDIDESANFQSVSESDRKTKDEALKFYKTLFKSPNVHILDVRISPFHFYETKIRRHVKYVNTYFTPFEEGFVFYKVVGDFQYGYSPLYNLFATVLFWKDKYKSFYVWDEPNTKLTKNHSVPIHEIPIGPEWYAKANKMGKWYPSEYEKCTREQRLKMVELKIPFTQSMSARKAEMEIEEKVIKKAIDQYLWDGKFIGIMEIK